MLWRKSWLLGLSILGACSDGGDPTATDPRLLFEDAFVSPPAEVKIVAEGGTRVRGLDGWLKLEPGLDGLRLRYPERFVYRDCAEPLAWFAGVDDELRLMTDSGGFVCQESVDPRFSSDNGRWLVIDRHRGLAYYRIWKHY
jgi:hypothetical protein